MYAIKAIFDGTNFTPIQPIPVKENYEVVITFIEPVGKDGGKTAKLPRSAMRGLLRGKVRMAGDFNEPLAHFNGPRG